MEYLTEEESSLLQQVSRVAETLIARSGCRMGDVVGTRGWGEGGALLWPPRARGGSPSPVLPLEPRGAPAAPAPLAHRIHEAAKAHKAMEQELAHAVNTSSLALSEALSNKTAGTSEVS